MAIEVRKNKSGVTYRAIWRNPLTFKQEKQSFADKHEANIFDALIKKRIKKDPQSFAIADPVETLTFSDLAARYMTEHKMKDTCYVTTFQIVQVKILPNIGDIIVSELSHAHLKAMENNWKAIGNKQPTRNRQISIVKAIMNWAVNEQILKINPISSYSCPRGETHRNPPPTQHEIDRIFQISAPHIKRVIIIGAGIGVRIGKSELLTMQWANVDWNAQSIVVYCAKKNDNMVWRDIPLSDDLFAIFKVWYEEDSKNKLTHIIHYRGKPVSCIRIAFKRSVARVGITRNIRPYDLRHYFATHTLGNGADLAATSALMGHSTTATTQRIYQHVIDSKRRDAVNRAILPTFAKLG